MKYLKILLIFALFNGAVYSQTKNKEFLDCKKCHDCAIPTKDNTCLKKCPRDLMSVVYHMPLSIPKVLIIDNFKSEPNHYPPVKFSHQAHAEMSSMSGSCQMCHHYNNAGTILGCKKCHEVERKRTDISKIDLKGAYHVQCMSCHRAWSNKVECVTCHNQPEKNSKTPAPKAVHPEMKRPVVKTYDTKYTRGKLVTFYHDEHTNTYGIECSNCHNNDGCIKCHNKEKAAKDTNVPLSDKHKTCSRCHTVEENCNKCHSDQKKWPFNHQVRTGFTLNQFHIKLSCQKCHTEKGKFSKINSECTTCHSKWNEKNFDHKKTGFQLDDTHIANECSACHIEKNYKNPVCTSCHDENFKYPDKKPGKLLKRKA